MVQREQARETTQVPFSSQRLEQVFARCFANSHRTRLAGGADEPLYAPGTDGRWHTLYYRADYFASALHEVAHWCIAGAKRRELKDFGYWYAADGRDASAQQAFEKVEAKPQALEWFFARACDWPFRISVDNLDAHAGSIPDTHAFRALITAEITNYRNNGLPQRARKFFHALCEEFGNRPSIPDLDTLPSELA